MSIQFNRTGTVYLLQQQLPNLPTELNVIHQAVDLEIAMKTALVKVGRTDDGPLPVNQHDLGVQDLPLHFKNFYPTPQQCRV